MFKVQIKTGNDAFGEDADTRNFETARILEELAGKLRSGRCLDEFDKIFLSDQNGCKVGTASHDEPHRSDACHSDEEE